MSGTIFLDKVKAGSRVTLKEIRNPQVAYQLLRAGFFRGSTVRCVHHIRSGPVIIYRRGTRFALGADVAHQILVEP